MSEQNQPKGGKFLDLDTWEAMKAAGFSEQELYDDQPTGPIIYSYSRKQAIEDGVLVDLTRPGFERVLRLEGIKIHCAMTDTAFATVVSADLEHDDLFQALCRLGRMLRALVNEARRQRDSDRVFFCVPGVNEQPVKMWSMVGPGDDAEPVMTIMLEGED